MTRAGFAALLFGLMVVEAVPAVAQWADAPAVRALYEAAKTEGQVVIWGTQQREIAWIPREFAEMFPGIDVKPYADSEIATRAMAEARSSHFEVDVIWSALTGAVPVVQRNLAAAIDWPIFGVTSDNLAFDGKMGFTNNVVYVIAYNTEQVKDADVAASWADLLDAKYAGKMVASLFSLPRLIGGLGQIWGEERSIQFTRELFGKAEILVTRGPRDAFLKSGDRPFAVAEIDTLARLWAADGLAIGYKVPEPIVANQFGTLVMAGAPHPNAARLLAGWMASQEGKRARERANGAIDYRPGSRNELARRIHASGVRLIFDTVEDARARDALADRATLILTGQAR